MNKDSAVLRAPLCVTSHGTTSIFQQSSRLFTFSIQSSFSQLTAAKFINELKINKSPGADNIGPKLVKATAHVIIDPLVHIYNRSILAGKVPDKMKIAKVIPVFKQGQKDIPSNYRPISLLSVLDKVLEKVICSRLTNFLTVNNVLYEYQFGFRKHHSTKLALIEVVDHIIIRKFGC